MAIEFREFAGWPKIQLGINSGSAQKKGLIAYTDLEAFVAEVFPVSFISGSGEFTGVGSQFPGLPWLRALSASFDPYPQRILSYSVASIAGNPTYEYYLATIDYGVPEGPTATDPATDPSQVDPIELLKQQWTVGGEFLTLPATGLKWEVGDTTVADDTNAGRVIPTIEHALTWPRVYSPPFSIMRSRIGTVNSGALTFSTGIIAAETLLYVGAELERTIMSNGERAWNLTHRFSERRVPNADGNGAEYIGGWNHFWRNDTPFTGWYRMLTADDGAIYEETTFDELFQAGA